REYAGVCPVPVGGAFPAWIPGAGQVIVGKVAVGALVAEYKGATATIAILLKDPVLGKAECLGIFGKVGKAHPVQVEVATLRLVRAHIDDRFKRPGHTKVASGCSPVLGILRGVHLGFVGW